MRIIGGRWRSRRIAFEAVDGLRPTPDRVRETLFNWLAPAIEGARCLDLFCGSGALGLEALSRGAGSVVFVDRSRAATAQLERNLSLLGAEGARVLTADCLDWIDQTRGETFDILFIDPPYRQGLVNACLERIRDRGLLAGSALVYVETGTDEPAPEIAADWSLHRDKRAGQVAYRLYRTDGP